MRTQFRSLTGAALLLMGTFATAGNSDEVPDFSGPLKISGLLWNTNPKSASKTLLGVIEKAVDRGQSRNLSRALVPLENKVGRVLQARDRLDPRWVPSLASELLTSSDPKSHSSQLIQTLADPAVNESGLLIKVWFEVDRESAFNYFAEGLTHADNPNQVSELISAAIGSDRVRATQALLASWTDLPQKVKTAAIEPLTASAETMQILVASVANGVVAKDLVNANQLRKWLQSDGEKWRTIIEPVWGKIREIDDAERQQLVEKTVKQIYSGASGSATNGQAIFARVCSQCHVLHGQGFEVGPNIEGNGRGSLQQLVSNVLDPSLVIGEAFLAKTVLTYDGNVIAGLVVAETDRYLKLKVQGGKIIELDKADDIELLKPSEKSLMPEGVEAQMTEQELLDLFAFLCLLKPLESAENSLIPGTPRDFVKP